jgi:hypothetical protein
MLWSPANATHPKLDLHTTTQLSQQAQTATAQHNQKLALQKPNVFDSLDQPMIHPNTTVVRFEMPTTSANHHHNPYLTPHG